MLLGSLLVGLVLFVLGMGDFRNTFLAKYHGNRGDRKATLTKDHASREDRAATKDNSIGKQIVVIVDISHEPSCPKMYLNITQ